ncbi:conserved hypothetical protein [Afipia carboxidovorans OM5]|uniref:DUF2336 domain-containing protein n=1 Tax=Afipia carboxidovorans (strain ATCC 49405 / DSM 1227 / KCTC 32145 / OM5) TaxID=504832 RepID=B6JG11_AFIC5|nr:DUF2336 domain-containing protein [Afipia carboxidovorans]ACI93738.1 conserved hypothetical protein [Afipia carboxidovorans OM5]AEI02580.1 hypothetical protein OCA4_c14400 [Afipia carboxidovorans OM4]AEI06156.1 hypothetical protein OCA5_c14400 [Afipia carboxidovorans OM5]
MSVPPPFQGFDGLLSLSRREGVDIRPTLLRVLTDLYVQTPAHTADEEQQFTELAIRLLDEVDDATRAMVRAKLAIYPKTPRDIRRKLLIPPPPLYPREVAPSLVPAQAETVVAEAEAQTADAPPLAPSQPQGPALLSMKPQDASSLIEMFTGASAKERARILESLADAPLKPSVKIDAKRATRAIALLEGAAMVADAPAFTTELADALILPGSVAKAIVSDPLGEPLACAMKVLGMSAEAFQRVLLFLNPAIGASVIDVYRLARMYDVLSERVALIMIAAWRGSSIANARAKYQPVLYDGERQRARLTPHTQPFHIATDDGLRKERV